MLKPIYCIYLLILYGNLCFSQMPYSAKLIDFDDGIPVANAQITDLETQKSILSLTNGEFSIESSGEISIKADGYEELILDLSVSKPNIIYLTKIRQELDAVVINSLSLTSSLKSSTSAVAVIENKDLQLNKTINLANVLNTVPGVFMQSATLNTNRITIRGIGARNLFGTANIRAYFGDIPLTDGNGESSIEDIELNTIGSMQILKGPSSSSYGVGLGGSILFNPEFADYNEYTSSLDYRYGSFGYNKFIINSKIGLKNASVNLTYSNIDYSGYRENNEVKRQTFTLSSKVDLGTSDKLTILGTTIDLKGGIPSSLSEQDFKNSPRSAAFTWGRAKSFEDVKYSLIGLSWRHDFKDNLTLISTANTSIKDNYEPRPFNILTEESTSLGLRSRVLKTFTTNSASIDLSLGAELFLDAYKNKTFENLYNEFNDDRGSVKGNQLTGFKEKRNYYNVFFEGNIKFKNDLLINLGLHLNQTDFKVKDNFQSMDLSDDGKFKFDAILSPKLGVSYAFNEKFIGFGSISHGFSTPTTAETLLPEGKFNADLKPEIGWNFELGGRFYFNDQRLYGSFSVYTMDVSDLLVTRRTQEDDFFAINAGKANYKGIEFVVNYVFLRTNGIKLVSENTANIINYRFKDFIDLDTDYKGNLIPGVPLYNYNIGLHLSTGFGLRSRLVYQLIGKMAANGANAVFNNDYSLLNLDISYSNYLTKQLSYEIYIDADNLFDTSYASQLQINAVGFGNSAPRFFYPGLPFNLYSGIKFTYFF